MISNLSHRLLAVMTVIVVAGSPAESQPSYNVADLGAPVSFHWDDWNSTNQIVQANGLSFFFQNDGSNGRELWRSDGSPLGTYMVRDLCPGSCGSRSWFRDPLAAVGDRVFFAGNDGVHGLELWVTDGTALGTRMVVDLHPGWESSFPALLTEASGQLFFTSSGAEGVTSLWRSDGTAKGTFRVSPPGVSFGSASSILPAAGFLYICNAGTGSDEGLWRSDGSLAGTYLLASVRCLEYWFDGAAQSAFLPDGALLFSGESASGGSELWRSTDRRPGPRS
jgi:ELWxxDGT repeat protein